MKHFLKIIFTILCLLGVTCSGMPAAEAGMISEKQEIEMGKATAEQIEARYGVLNDPVVADRVNRIGQSLVDVCGRKNINDKHVACRMQDKRDRQNRNNTSVVFYHIYTQFPNM